MSYKPNTWRYEPTPSQIAEECRKIQKGWSRHERIQRLARKPIAGLWTPLVLLDTVNERGDFVLIVGESHYA